MTTQEELVARLRPLGMRLTPQRLAVAEVVVNSGDDPTVKDIYERVREFFPYVTLATVYSTLAVLEQAGIVRELPFPRQSRYDANLTPHANLVCLGCGGVVDAEVGQETVAELRRRYPPAKVLPVLYGCSGLVDVVTVRRALGEAS